MVKGLFVLELHSWIIHVGIEPFDNDLDKPPIFIDDILRETKCLKNLSCDVVVRLVEPISKRNDI